MIFREQINKSLLLLLPLISNENEDWTEYTGEYKLSEDRNTSFVNGYYSDVNRPYMEECIHLMFETEIDIKFDLKKKELNENYQSKYLTKIDDKFYMIYSFKIPDRFKRDYKLMVKGKYSKLDDETKTKIVDFWKLNPKSQLFKSLYTNGNSLSTFTDELIKEEEFIDRYGETLLHENSLSGHLS
jgi:hypothetical protein